MLNILGLGLRGFRSLTTEEVGLIKEADRVYIDSYTSVLAPQAVKEIGERTGKNVEAVERNVLENSNFLFEKAENEDVCLLVSGDPFMATTHNEIRYQCSLRGIRCAIFENASILNTVIGFSGLSPYRVGPPVSVPRLTDSFFPVSVYRKIFRNLQEKRHTILLLDTSGIHPMTVNEALDVLEKMEKVENGGIILPGTHLIIAAEVGLPTGLFLHGTLSSVKKRNVGAAPATIIIPAELDENEDLYVSTFCESL